jgi:hypothetical protein
MLGYNWKEKVVEICAAGQADRKSERSGMTAHFVL